MYDFTGAATIGVEHNFETAHRLPFLGGKCTNLHGHSWKVKIHFLYTQYQEGMDSQGISTDYGLLKKVVREWIDDKLDHGCMLGAQDWLAPVLLDMDSKVFIFGNVEHLANLQIRDMQRFSYNLPAEDRNYPTLPWPTVEATARMIAEKIQKQIDSQIDPSLKVIMVGVTETSTNTALWTPAPGLLEDPADGMSEEYSPTAQALRGEIRP